MKTCGLGIRTSRKDAAGAFNAADGELSVPWNDNNWTSVQPTPASVEGKIAEHGSLGGDLLLKPDYALDYHGREGVAFSKTPCFPQYTLEDSNL